MSKDIAAFQLPENDKASSQLPEFPETDDVVSQVRAQVREGAVAPGQPRQRAQVVKMKEMRLSRSPWVIRGLIGALVLLLAGEILLLQLAQRPPDVSQFEIGPTMVVLATPAPDWTFIEPPPVKVVPHPPLEILPDPPTPTPLPTP